MGMFDSVFAPCPKCGEDVEFQSKAGDCMLRRYRHNNVPVIVALDVNLNSEVCKCGEVVTLMLNSVPARVAMTVASQSTDTEGQEWD